MKNKKNIIVISLPLILWSCIQNTNIAPISSSSMSSPLMTLTPSIYPSSSIINSDTPSLIPSVTPVLDISATPTPVVTSTPIKGANVIDNIIGKRATIYPIEEDYNGHITLIVDTHLFLGIFPYAQGKIYPRKLYVFKESYDELTNDEINRLKERFGSFEVYNLNNFESLNDIDFVDGDVNDAGAVIINSDDKKEDSQYFYKSIFISQPVVVPVLKKSEYKEEFIGRYSNIKSKNIQQHNSFYLKNIVKNIKSINEKKLAFGQIKEMVFSSFREAGTNAEYFDIMINNTDLVSSVFRWYYNTEIEMTGSIRHWRRERYETNHNLLSSSPIPTLSPDK